MVSSILLASKGLVAQLYQVSSADKAVTIFRSGNTGVLAADAFFNVCLACSDSGAYAATSLAGLLINPCLKSDCE